MSDGVVPVHLAGLIYDSKRDRNLHAPAQLRVSLQGGGWRLEGIQCPQPTQSRVLLRPKKTGPSQKFA